MSKPRRTLVLGAILALATGCGQQQSSDSQPVAEGVAEPSTAPAERARRANELPDGTLAPSTDSGLGPAIQSPERYYGLYAAPDRPNRQWFITEARNPEYAEFAPDVPPGHLMLGAMFGDVAPWQLRTLSETEFVQARLSAGANEPIEIEFRLDDSSRATALRFSGGPFANEAWLERVGDLPEGW